MILLSFFVSLVFAGSGGANDDSASCNEDSSVLINVLGNDSGLTKIGQISDPPHGNAMEENGHIRYTPDPNWHGTDSFTYTAMSAGLYFSDNGHYYEYISHPGITWESARDAAAAKTYYGLKGYLVTVTSAAEQNFVSSKLQGQGWMGASDNSNENHWYWVTGPESGTEFYYGRYSSGQGSCPYSVSPSYYGYTNWASNEPNDWDCNEDYGHFWDNGTWNDYASNNGAIQGYVVEYGGMAGDSPSFPQATVTVTVNAVNDPPTTSNGSFNVNEDSTYNGSLPVYSDIDGGPTFTYSIHTQAGHGTATVTNAATGAFSYTPTGNYFGGDSFVFQVSDGRGGTHTATVTVSVVSEVNDPPVANDQTRSTNEDTLLTGTATASDVDHDPQDTLTFSLLSGPAHGGATVATNGYYEYLPSANYFGPDSFVFQVSDGRGGVDTGTISITVIEVNDPPVANDQYPSTQEDNVLTGTVTASDVDYGPFDTLVYSVFTPPIHGSLTITTNGGFTYTPDTHYNGPDSFEFLVIDQSNGDPRGGSDTGLVSITVEPVDDAPEVEILLDTSVPLKGAIEIPYLIKDNDTNPAPGVESDKCSIIVEFFHNGQWQNATMEGRSEPMFGLDARPEGFRHSFTWDSGRDLPNQIVTDIKVRIKASDGFAYGGWAEIGPFTINNTSVVPINAVLQSAYNLRLKTVESLQSEIMEQLSTGCKDSGVLSATCNIPDEVKVLWMQAEMHMENSRNTGNTVEALNELKLAKELYEQILEILSS
ncbi:MAG TPA: tandem-95 repeat protein [Candidatus Methanofastidiosum sp.]|nr:tandem-95 repeat protein [Methanofastidiosum sp.]